MLSLLLALLTLAPVAQAATLLVFGDSLSAGYGIDKQAAWPLLLADKLKAAGYRLEVANASISGETTAGGRSRIAATLQQHKPSIVILELGANDGLRGLSLKAMRDNLQAMITAAQQANAKVLLVGMRMPPNFGQAYTEKFHQTYVDLAKTQHVALLPFMMEGFAQKRSLFIEDGMHPTAEAQPLIVANLWPVLKPLLGKK